jgi:HAD superfamily hydrolase (TIGR01509 family)
VVIFDCNGVLVDSESIASAVLAQAFMRAGFPIDAEVVARRFHGRRLDDIVTVAETASGKKLPENFTSTVTFEMLRRFRSELRPLPHVTHALAWIRGPKAVASSASLDRIRGSLEIAGLLRFFGSRLFSASDVPHGKPAPDLFRHAAAKLRIDPADCVVVEDSAAGIGAAVAAGMTAIGFIGASPTPDQLAGELRAAGARAVVSDMRHLKSAIADQRGW